MTKCSLLLVPFLVAIAVSDALPARAAGTLPQSATSVQDKATESTVSGKRALRSKEDTKGAADEERALISPSILEPLSNKMKSTTDSMARTGKGASLSVSGVSQKELEEMAIAVELENARSDLQKITDSMINAIKRDSRFLSTRKVGRPGITWDKPYRGLRKKEIQAARDWLKTIHERDATAAELANAKKMIADINAAI
uniref:RXLR effector n=1 Tax=Hyaloperonospora arabidopsidis TaxID=272952 RepID=F6MF00_HYAAB|nr:RXLR effector [Hyaloperonospora arabidopsidis]